MANSVMTAADEGNVKILDKIRFALKEISQINKEKNVEDFRHVRRNTQVTEVILKEQKSV